MERKELDLFLRSRAESPLRLLLREVPRRSNVGGGYECDGLANETLHWMVEKAEALGLSFDSASLAPLQALLQLRPPRHDDPGLPSLGDGTRRLGSHRADGESLHQAALDRRAYPPCRYHPPSLDRVALPGAPRVMPAVTTTKIKRGEPCRGPAGREPPTAEVR
jgi:hypothetical protein